MSNLNKKIDNHCQTNLSTDEIRRQLLSQLEGVLRHLLPKGKRQHHHYHVGNIYGDSGDSLKVELQGSKAGMWHDFASGEGGDIFDLWANVKGLNTRNDFPGLIEEIKNWLGIYEPSPANHGLDTLAGKWEYTDKVGKVIASVQRYNIKDGGKKFIPWDAIFKRYKLPSPRPLYNQVGMVSSQRIILVEGEKCAQGLIDQGICATTAMGGANASIDKTDWSPLKGKDVIIWPDNDEVGKSYAQKAGTKLLEIGVSSLKIIEIPADKPAKWDVADGIFEGINLQQFIEDSVKKDVLTEELLPSHGGEEIWDDLSAAPEDIISPSILIPESLLVFGGAPKVGKTDFLITWMVHMAAGLPFMDMVPARPLKIFYLQAELSYHSFKKRLQRVAIDQDYKLIAKKNLAMTSKLNVQLNEQGVNLAYKTIYRHFKNEVDIIVIDPLRNFFDGGTTNASENDNVAMMLFLQKRLEVLRNKLNPKAGIILAHHTRKITKDYLEEETFQALSGASALRGYYTTGIILYRPDEKKPQRQLIFELREGEEISPKSIEKIVGGWLEIEPESSRLIHQEYGKKLDAERERRHDVILDIIDAQASKGKIFTMKQFCEAFENKKGLGGVKSIRARLDVLSTNGYIKFIKNGENYGFKNPSGTKFGYLCVENMQLKTLKGEVMAYPSHYKCRETGAALEVENPKIWVYADGCDAAIIH